MKRIGLDPEIDRSIMFRRTEGDSNTPQSTKEKWVADVLREGIIAGEFRPGSRLKQVEIAKMLNTSITPVREALNLLEAEGYLTSMSHRGAVVGPSDDTAPDELLALRLMLEGRLVSQAVERLTTADLARLRGLADELIPLVENRDRAKILAVNYRFHFALYEIAASPQALRFARMLWARFPLSLLLELPGRSERSVIEHEALLQALARRDVSEAVAALRNHIETGCSEISKCRVVKTT
jgi:DNA-binding GntR family transcriptional regulator